MNIAIQVTFFFSFIYFYPKRNCEREKKQEVKKTQCCLSSRRLRKDQFHILDIKKASEILQNTNSYLDIFERCSNPTVCLDRSYNTKVWGCRLGSYNGCGCRGSCGESLQMCCKIIVNNIKKAEKKNCRAIFSVESFVC